MNKKKKKDFKSTWNGKKDLHRDIYIYGSITKHTHTHTQAYIHMYVHIYIYTYICIYIYIHKQQKKDDEMTTRKQQ